MSSQKETERNHKLRILASAAVFFLAISLLLSVVLLISVPRNVQAEEAEASITLPALKEKDTHEKLINIAKTNPTEFLELALEHYQHHIKDYTCTFIKQELLGSKYTQEQYIKVKFLDRPFAVFMKWIENAELVDRVLYVKGRYGDKALVKPAGLLGWFVIGHIKRPVNGPDAAKVSRKRLDQFGFENNLKLIIEINKLAEKKNELDFRFIGEEDFAGRKTLKFQRILPDKPEYPDQKLIVYIDKEWLVPVGIYCYNSRGKLLGKYIYKDIRLNVGLALKEFSPEANGL